MDSILINQLVLLVVFAGGALVGLILHSVLKRRAHEGDDFSAALTRLTDSIGFVAGAVGLLLGLLLSLSVSVFQDTQNAINSFNSTMVETFHAVEVYPEAERHAVRDDLACTVSTFFELEVNPDVTNDGNGVLQTDLWFAQLNKSITKLPLETNHEIETYGYIVSNAMELAGLRNQILATSTQNLPEIIWVVIYGSVFALALLLALSFADKRRFFLITTALAYLTLAFMLLGLTILQSPLHNVGLGGVVVTENMQSLVTEMDLTYPDQPTPECPVLTAGQYHVWE